MTGPVGGVRLALDWGQSRIGVAACDAGGTLAYPVETITGARDQERVMSILDRLVAEYEPRGLVIGLPRHLNGSEGENARLVRQQAHRLARRFPALEVRLVDERLSTRTAARQLHEAGFKAREHRGMIDQVAAVAILNTALDAERVSGTSAGELIEKGSTP